MRNRSEFCRWVRQLRREFPGLYPVRVMLVPGGRIPGAWGDCVVTLDGDGMPERFLIRVADNQSEQQTRETLWEEWAHYLRLHLPMVGKAACHDELYGVIFNLIKRRHHDGEDGNQEAPG